MIVRATPSLAEGPVVSILSPLNVPEEIVTPRCVCKQRPGPLF